MSGGHFGDGVEMYFWRNGIFEQKVTSGLSKTVFLNKKKPLAQVAWFLYECSGHTNAARQHFDAVHGLCGNLQHTLMSKNKFPP